MCGHVFTSFGSISRNTIAGSFDKSLFSFAGNHHTVFQNGCYMLHSHKQWVNESFSCSTFSPAFGIIMFLNFGQSNTVWWYLIVLNCISLMICGMKHLFLCLFAICTSSLVKCLLRSLIHFFDLFSYCWILRVIHKFWIWTLYKIFFFFPCFGYPVAYGASRAGSRSELQCSCDLCCSCINARSLTHCARPGIELVSQQDMCFAKIFCSLWLVCSFS